MKPVSIGLLGHVDAGKTALARALSTTLSTAALDKHPESQRRGITLDIGVSCFQLADYHVTVVDCPGHAAFIRSVLAGASIVQILLILLDASQGVQAQTAEALGIAEALQLPVICVVNKADLVPSDRIEKIKGAMSGMLAKLKLDFVLCRASAGLGDVQEVREALQLMLSRIYASISDVFERQSRLPFEMFFDHSFGSKNAPIFTGTVISGVLRTGDQVAISPGSGVKNGRFEAFAVKSIQSFRTDVKSAGPGLRIGVQLTGGSAAQERGLLCAPEHLLQFRLCKSRVRILKQYQQGIHLAERFGLSIGGQTVQARVFPIGDKDADVLSEAQFEKAKSGDFSHKRELFCWILLDSAVQATENARFIGVRTDLAVGMAKSATRIAFSGAVLSVLPGDSAVINHQVVKKYMAEVDRKPRDGFSVIKQIRCFPEHKSPVNARLLQTQQGEELEVGKVTAEFGQGKFKALFTERFDAGLDVFVEDLLVQEFKIE